ncbi:MAG: hypothetical protein ACFFBP_12520 [Promethearchaeota archaeon]
MIQEILILNKAGIALFYHSFTDRKILDIQIVASFIDLICRFTRGNLNVSLKSFTLKDRKIIFYSHKSGYHVVFICKIKPYKEKLFKNLADILIKKFLNLYKNELKDFNGEISTFRSFSQIVEQTINPKFLDMKKIPTIEY